MWNDVLLLIISAFNHVDDTCEMMCFYLLSVHSIMKYRGWRNFYLIWPIFFSFSSGYSFTVSTGPTRNLLLFWFFPFFRFSMIFLWTVNNSVLRNWLSHTCPSYFFVLKGVSILTFFLLLVPMKQTLFIVSGNKVEFLMSSLLQNSSSKFNLKLLWW